MQRARRQHLPVNFSCVIFDWRGTLVTTLSRQDWAEEALRLAGRERSAAHVEAVLQAVEAVDPDEARLDARAWTATPPCIVRRTWASLLTPASMRSLPVAAADRPRPLVGVLPSKVDVCAPLTSLWTGAWTGGTLT